MQAKAEWKSGPLFRATTESGHTLLFDTAQPHTAAPSPMEAVLAALCACTSVDVVNILRKKRQELLSLTVTAEAKRMPEPPRAFTEIHLRYCVAGEALSAKAVEDAVALSKNKYCSVSAMLQSSVRITSSIEYAAAAAHGVRQP